MKLAKIHGFRKPPRAGLPPKILLVMRLTTFFMLAACLEVQAHGYSQAKFTLSEKDAPIPRIFQVIERQSDYHFFYDYPIFQQAAKVSVEVKNASIDQVLALCFRDQPFSYSIEGTLILVKRKTPAPPANAPPSVIAELRGQVTNEAGEPLQGATVEVQNAKTGTFTDAKGMFTLKNISSNAILEITFTGYQKTTVKVAGMSPLSIVLKVATNSLDQVQIIAYGTTSQRLTTGNVNTVTAREIEEQPVNNPLLALEGRVPGLFITQNNGLPGTSIVVRIQGQNSIANGNDPFYVIDGVPYTSQLLQNWGSILGNGGVQSGVQLPSGNPLSFINPEDIESIEVLKDADATAIYGSRAANGAILITTKKGVAGKTKADINVQDGWGHVARKQNLMNTEQYLQMRLEAISNDDDSLSDPNLYAPDLLLWDTTRYTDWQKTLIGGTAHYNDNEVSVSGGNSSLQYLIGGNYHKETTVFPGTFSDQKTSLHFNVNNVSSDGRFRIQFSGSYLVDNNHLPTQDLTQLALTLPPDAPMIYTPNGSLNWVPSTPGQVGTWTNPYSYLNTNYNNQTDNLIGNANLGYMLLPGLELKGSLGYNNIQADDANLIPLKYYDPGYWFIGNSLRAATYSNNSIRNWIVEPQLSYKKHISKGLMDLLVGSTIQKNNTDGKSYRASGFNSDLELGNIQDASSVLAFQNQTVYKYNALFGRLNYNWKDKYLLNYTLRRDGSSRFGPQSQFHNFTAIGVAWIFSREDFIRRNVPLLSFGKIKGSFGTTGSDQILDYSYMDLYTSTSVGVPYQGATGLVINNLTNPNLQWEETKKLNGGLELGFLKDRILGNLDYFNNRSSNQLLPYPVASTTGFQSISKNLPATVQNSGWEISVNTINFKNRSFTWSSSINLTIPKNKLIAFPNLNSSSYASSYIIGEPITLIKAFHFLGVNPATGIYQFSDGNKGVTTTPDTNYDATATSLINSSPTMYGGFDNMFTYKGFQLDIFFQFVRQKGRNYLFGFYPGTEGNNQPLYVLSRWQKPGDITNIQRYNSDYSLFQQDADAAQSDAGYSDASYIRLKNLSLSWQIPEQWQHKMHIQNLKLFCQGQNLFLFTHYKGLDPETLSTTTLPTLRVVTVGVHLTL